RVLFRSAVIQNHPLLSTLPAPLRPDQISLRRDALHPWRTAHSCSRILGLTFVAFTILTLTLTLVSCGGNSASTSASVVPTPTPGPSPAPSPSPSPTPTVTTSATVIDRIEEAPWLTCGACGNTGGTGAIAAYSDTLGIA